MHDSNNRAAKRYVCVELYLLVMSDGNFFPLFFPSVNFCDFFCLVVFCACACVLFLFSVGVVFVGFVLLCCCLCLCFFSRSCLLLCCSYCVAHILLWLSHCATAPPLLFVSIPATFLLCSPYPLPVLLLLLLLCL